MPDLLLNEEERMLQNTIREFANKELAPRASEIDEKEEFSWESWKSLASLGLTGIGIDPAYGGSGGGYRQVSLAMEEIARGDAATSTSLIAHLCLGTRTIFEFGDESQKQRYVPDLAEGNKMAAWALTEPSCGSDAAALQTTADFRDGTYFLNGSKIFITNADTASHVVVFATQDKSLRAKGVGAFVVDPETPGFTVHKQHGKMGMRGSATTEITMENVPVPEANRLGEEGRGFNYAMDILDSSRIIIAAQCVGIAQAALEAAVRYAQQRQTFGKPIAQHQAVQFMLADMAVEIHAARVATIQAATLKDQGLDFVYEASIAKLLASETAVSATSNALQVHGGYGYFKDSPVERYFRDARATTVYEGTSQVQKLIIARQLLSQYPL